MDGCPGIQPVLTRRVVNILGATAFGLLFTEVAATTRHEVLGGLLGLAVGLIITSLWQHGSIGRPVIAASLGALMGLILMSGVAAQMYLEELTISA